MNQKIAKFVMLSFTEMALLGFPILADTIGESNELISSITDFCKETFKDRIFLHSTNQRFNFTISNLTASDSMIINMRMQYSCYSCDTDHSDAVKSIPVIIEREKEGKFCQHFLFVI